jgi:hypothetical protein
MSLVAAKIPQVVIHLFTFLVATVLATFVVGTSSCLSITLPLEPPVNLWGSAFIFPSSTFSFGSATFVGQAKGAGYLPLIRKPSYGTVIKLRQTKPISVQVQIQNEAVMLAAKHLV